MKKFFLALMFAVSFMFALDTSVLIDMVKQNPSLLDTQQGQMLLQKYGVSKKEVLDLVQSDNKIREITPVNISNKIETVTQNSLVEQNTTRTFDTNDTNDANESNITVPLQYKSAEELIKQIKRSQQKQKHIELKRFGEKFFYNKNTLSKENISVPEYYHLNTGDVLSVQIFGGNDKTYELNIDNNGNIILPVIGPVHVAGYSVSEVKDLIKRKLKPSYPNSKILVGVKTNSFIQVTLSGYVAAPGVYNLSSLSTIKDLLIAANGFGSIGSMRSVYLKRGGRLIKTIDFYQLIKDGKVVDTTLLRNGDVVYVPRSKTLVRLSGAVSTPAVYEMKKNETLKDLISYSGGFLPDASKNDIKIKRYINNSYIKIMFKDINDSIRFLNGDDVYVYKVSELNKDYVYVYGNIEKPGSYEIPSDSRLSSLLKKVSFLKDTYYGYGLIERFDGSMVSFNLKNPGDVKLQSKDEIYIFNRYEINPNMFVKVDGDVVARPGKLRFIEGMSVKDAVLNAGLKYNFDKNRVEIVRYNEKMEPEIFFINYETNSSFRLKPYDEITLYKYTDFNPVKPIVVYGEVNKPDVCPYSKDLTLESVINVAGGFTYKADKKYIELIRYRVINNKRTRQIIKLSYDEDKNFKIKPYDEINVKAIPNWNERKSVTIKGEVKYPGVYTIKNGEKLADVIKRAGGFTDDAYLYGAVFTRESVRKMQEKRLKTMIYKLKKKVAVISASAKGAGEQSINAKSLMDAIDALAVQAEKLKPIGRIAIKLESNLTKFAKSPYNISLEDKDTLFVPSKPDSVIVMGEVLTPSAFVYTDKDSLGYIKKAGGTTSMADDIYFVVHANGFTDKGKFGVLWDDSINIKPGDAITVPIKIQTSTWFGIAKDITSITYQLAITAASLKTVGAF